MQMTCNHGYNELFKLFLDLGGDYHGKDDFDYTCMLYTVKSNSMNLFFYLVYLGANLNAVDKNNISI
jgi:ankyrin repeat protein